MSLTPGTRLGPYEVIGPLGAGGMGEVHRARDTNLERDVALKILPEALADGGGRLERFEREAKTLAALNHPSIVTIYSVEADEGRHFLTMELVEGKTLDQHIPADGLALVRLFDLAIPIADALAEAHAKGITHRDLKPANVMVNEKGQVKIVDFGLAKLAEGGAGGETEATVALISPDGTMVAVKELDGQIRLYSAEGGEGREVPGVATNEIPVAWSRSGDSLFLWDQKFPASVESLDLESGRRRLVHTIEVADPTGVLYGNLFMTTDGHYYMCRYRRVLSRLFLVDGAG